MVGQTYKAFLSVQSIGAGLETRVVVDGINGAPEAPVPSSIAILVQ